jgi:hypothetical protein
MKNKILIGIDPGVKNGFAIYDCDRKKLLHVCSLKTYEVFERIKAYLFKGNHVTVYIEDPTTWKPFKGSGNQAHRMKGAGSVTARFKAITEFLEDTHVLHFKVPIQGNAKKMDANMFKRITGYTELTNEHGRDAALLIINKSC